MSNITVTVTFDSFDQASEFLIRYASETPPDHRRVITPPPEPEPEPEGKPKRTRAPKQEPEAPAKTERTVTKKAEPKAAKMEYSELQNEVFALARLDRDRAVEIVNGLGVGSYKELPEEKWPEALEQVKAAIAELSV